VSLLPLTGPDATDKMRQHATERPSSYARAAVWQGHQAMARSVRLSVPCPSSETVHFQ